MAGVDDRLSTTPLEEQENKAHRQSAASPELHHTRVGQRGASDLAGWWPSVHKGHREVGTHSRRAHQPIKGTHTSQTSNPARKMLNLVRERDRGRGSSST